MKKKLLSMLLVGMLSVLSVSAVYADETDERIAEIESQIKTLQDELNGLKEKKMQDSGGSYIPVSEYVNLFTDGNAYKGRDVKLAGKMYGAMEQDENSKYFQMFYNLGGDDKSVIVQCDSSTADFVNDDYVLITGKIAGTSAGKNAFGGEIRALVVLADTAEKTDYATAINPAMKVLEPNLQIDQYGYVVSIPKVEFAENETRLYVTVMNNGISKFWISPYSAKVIQGSTQYEYEYNYEANYPELQSELMSGTQTSGIICFPAMDANADIVVYLGGSSDNYDEDISDYQFNINVN